MTQEMRYVKNKQFGTAAVAIDNDLVALSWVIGPDVPENFAVPRVVFEELIKQYEALGC